MTASTNEDSILPANLAHRLRQSTLVIWWDMTTTFMSLTEPSGTSNGALPKRRKWDSELLRVLVRS